MNEQLQQLLQVLLKTESGSTEEKLVIEKILRLIPSLPGIRKQNDPSIDYQATFNLALEGVWKGIRRFAEKSSPRILQAAPEVNQRYFVAWFNKILMNKIYDMYRQQQRQPLSLDIEIGDGNTPLEFQEDPININTIDYLIKQETFIENQEKEKKLNLI